MANLFLHIFLAWWDGWEFRGIDWTFSKYAYMVVTPTLMFFSCGLIIPQPIDEQRVNLEAHFFKVRRLFLSSYFLAFMAAVVDGSVLDDEPLWFPGRIVHVALLGIVVGGLLTTNRWWQTLFAAVVMMALTYIAVFRMWLPG